MRRRTRAYVDEIKPISGRTANPDSTVVKPPPPAAIELRDDRGYETRVSVCQQATGVTGETAWPS
jgi:hypothetical protein